MGLDPIAARKQRMGIPLQSRLRFMPLAPREIDPNEGLGIDKHKAIANTKADQARRERR